MTAENADKTCIGPKKRVAILRFGGTGKYGAYEGWDVGEAIAGQLATALEATDCFVIADRMVLSEVLREQELGLAGVVDGDTASQAGRLIGAQVLIKGEITEFETGKKGNGLNLGFGFSNIPLGLRLGGNRNVAHIAIDLRLIDASTGEILFSETISSEAKNYGLALGVDYDKGSIGTDHFSKTPFGKAVRGAATESAGYHRREPEGGRLERAGHHGRGLADLPERRREFGRQGRRRIHGHEYREGTRRPCQRRRARPHRAAHGYGQGAVRHGPVCGRAGRGRLPDPTRRLPPLLSST